MPAQPPRFVLETDDRYAAQAARGLAAALRQGGGSVTMRLQPEQLGDLRVRVDLAGDRVEASFEVESEQARQLLDRTIADLRSALEARGLEVDRLEVRIADRGSGAGHDSPPSADQGDIGGADGRGGAGSAGEGPDEPGHERWAGSGAGSGGVTHGTARTPPPGAAIGVAQGWASEQWCIVEAGGGPVTRVRLDAVA